MSTIALPNFDFNSLTTELLAKQMINPSFQQAVLKTVQQPKPVSIADFGGKLPSDFPFSTMFEYIDQSNKILKDFAKHQPVFEIEPSEIAVGLMDYINKYVKASNFLSLMNEKSLSKKMIIPIQYMKADIFGDAGVTVVLTFGSSYQGSTMLKTSVAIKVIKGGLRISIIKNTKLTDKHPKIDTISLPKSIFDEPVKTVVENIFNKAFNAIWNQKDTREYFFNVPQVLQTLVGRSSLLDDDGGMNEVIASRIANSAVQPFSNATIDELDKLPFGTVMNIGDYILAKYSSNVETLYGLIDLNSGNYTNKAFDEFNLKLYGKAKGFDIPVILVDPNQNADILSIISKYNMLYPATLLKQLIANFQFKGTINKKISAYMNFTIGQEIASLDDILYLKLDSEFGGIVDEQGQLYTIRFSKTSNINYIYKGSSVQQGTQLDMNAVNDLFKNHSLKWIGFDTHLINMTKIFNNDIGLVTKHYYAGFIFQKLFKKYDKAITDTVYFDANKSYMIANLKNNFVFEKHGASWNVIIGGFGQYAILIDSKDDGTPYYMVQYLKNKPNTSFRLVLSNQIDPSSAQGLPYWETYGSKQNGHSTATELQTSSIDKKIPYNPKYAMPTVDDAIEMIIVHIMQTAKTGFAFWEQADIKVMPTIETVSQYYYSMSSDNWSIKSVTIPSKLDGIVCGAMLVIPKGIGQEPKVFLVQQNGQWSIPMMNLTVGEEIESCAKDALQSMFIELPNDFEFSGASLSSTNKKDKSKVFHTVIFQVTETNANNWTPQITKGQKISGYAWVNASELEINTTASKLGDVSWKPTILDELSSGQDFVDKGKNQQTFEAILGAWKTHSDTWKKSAPIDPRLAKLIDPINLEQMKKFDGLYFDGIQYNFDDAKVSLFSLPNESDLMPIQQRIAGFDGYKSNPRKNPIKTAKMAGYRQNGLGAVFRYDDNQMSHLVRLNPRRKIELGIHQNELDQYKPIVEKVLGVKNPSNDLLESAYALDSIGFALENAKRNPKDNSVMTLNLDETKAVVQFADYVKEALGGTETDKGSATKEQNALRDRIHTAYWKRGSQPAGSGIAGGGIYDTEDKIIVDGRSVPQWFRYMPLLRILGMWKNQLDIGSRTVERSVGENLIILAQPNSSIRANDWSYAQLASMKQHFPQETATLTDDLTNSANFVKVVDLWIKIQNGNYGSVLVRDNEQPIWHKKPYEPNAFKQVTLATNSDNTIQSLQYKNVPAIAVENYMFHLEGFWCDYFAYTFKKKTSTEFSAQYDWSYGGGGTRLRSNTRDPRFINFPGKTGTGGSLPYSGELGIMFIYVDKTPLTCQIIGDWSSSAVTNMKTDNLRAWMTARPPYPKEPTPKGQYSDFAKKI